MSNREIYRLKKDSWLQYKIGYWKWKLKPPYFKWYGSAWYWECQLIRFGYWFPCYQAGSCAGELRGIGLYLRIGRFEKKCMIIPTKKHTNVIN